MEIRDESLLEDSRLADPHFNAGTINHVFQRCESKDLENEVEIRSETLLEDFEFTNHCVLSTSLESDLGSGKEVGGEWN